MMILLLTQNHSREWSVPTGTTAGSGWLRQVPVPQTHCCGFGLVATPNTRGKTVEQSLYMDVCARIYNELNRHPKAPQTNKQTNARTDIFKHNCIVMMIDDDSSAYSESFTRVECTSREDRRVRATSSAPGTTDPFCGFCLVTTPNTRGETVEQSLYMDVCARIYNE